jgi:hypothetical protein
MSTQKHTDGPWKFRFESIDQEWAIVTTASGSIIANVNSDHHQKANAHLIASAPDLLWMLKRLTAEGEYGQLPLLTLQQAREVISKAEGAQ